ncbi:hypothetical protein PFMG_04997 [Plasmodium falciparum IGH-CR14]|uniref:Uncharacterized protein n=1 Tax=Plasmodium falciparum IGH-CR14 TaxID=580059 RepID=A0A0L1IH57_PLAFA|nr:hypothetical protein PFMG_04997 [Plasmodium falciparum IGH-CR14]
MLKNKILILASAVSGLSILPITLFSSSCDKTSEKDKELLKSFDFQQQKNGNYVISKYKGNEENVNIPSEFKGKKVDAIGAQVFANNIIVKSIILPESIKEIGASAFLNSILDKITLNEGLATMGESAFEGTEIADITTTKFIRTNWK